MQNTRIGFLKKSVPILLILVILPFTPVSITGQDYKVAASRLAALHLLEIEKQALQKTEKIKTLKLGKIHSILKKYQTGLSKKMEITIAELIYEESQTYNYDPELIMALMAKESSFYNWSKSRKGALGLMQILPNTGKALALAKNIPWHGKKTLFDPESNIKMGTHYLSTLHKRFGQIEVALTAYNYGPARVANMQARDQKLPKAYTARILKTYEKFMALGPKSHDANPFLEGKKTYIALNQMNDSNI